MASKFVVCLLLILSLSMTRAAYAMSSTNFLVNWDSVNSGGDDVSSSTNYMLHDTVGEQGVGVSSSTNFELRAGYRFGDVENGIINFSIGVQENATEVSYTSFSQAGALVDVTSVAFFSVGDFIAVVENKGFSQMVAVGKIIQISGNRLYVDAWDGVPELLNSTPSGGDDFVYRLSGSAAQLGTLTTSTQATTLSYTDVVSNVERGYTVYVQSDGALLSGSDTIDAVSDGAVTVGSEEYGLRIFGQYATSTGSDISLTTSTQAVQLRSTYADADRIAVVYKAAISTSTASGSYSQQVYYTITANF